MCRYGLVGVVGAIIDIGLLNILVIFTELDIYHAIVLSLISAVIVSYFLHSSWTFKVTKGVDRMLIYSFMAVFSLILNVVIMYFFMEHLHWWYNYAKIAALFVVVIWNYGVSKALIFKTRNK